MAITVSTVENLDPYAFKSLGFDQAQSYVADAAENFAGVRRVVEAGHAWSGEGQPQAATVMATNALALRASALQMKAGVSATNGLVTALLKAQRELRAFKADLGDDKTLDEDGTVSETLEATEPGVQITSKDDELTARAQAILTFVEFADLTAEAILNRIANVRPRFSGNVRPAAVAYNKAMLELAKSAVNDAKASEFVWEHVSPGDWKFDGSDLGQEAKEFYYQFNSGALSGGWELTGVGAGLLRFGIPVFAGPYGWVAGLLILGGVGWIGYDFLSGDDDIEKGPPGLEEPTNLFGVAPDVEDKGLQEILDALYLDPDSPLAQAGITTVLGAAALQRAGVPGLPEGDYAAQARDLRDQLDDYFDAIAKLRRFEDDNHQFPEDFGVSREDLEVARSYRKLLNASLD